MDTRNELFGLTRLFIADFNASYPDNTFCDTLLGWVRARDYERLAGSSALFNSALHSVEDFRFLLQVEAFFKKNVIFADEKRCVEEAERNFHYAESLCRRTNRRLDFYYLHPDRNDPDVKFWLLRMRRDISRLLGDFSRFLEVLPRRIRVTEGATATRSRRKSLPYLKVSKRPTATARASKYLEALSEYFGYGNLKVRWCPYNRVALVPKNWKTHRTVAGEPDGNVPLQLAFDAYAKDRLRNIWGIDLSDQLRNQRLAEIGSLGADLATVDLKMASDTCAYNTVALLFPTEWFTYLDDIRAPLYTGPFGTGRYSKFSSMGNGSTFCIETLIFAAACRAVGSRANCVYGDDIVIESSLFDDLKRLLHYLGFVVNQEKSFASGPYRESCGTHWFQGVLVTPFYVRGWSESNKAQMAHNINGLVTVSIPGGLLWNRLLTLAEPIQAVPFNNISTSGVWIDAHSAYGAKLVRRKSGSPKYRAYTAHVNEREAYWVWDSRTLFLWHLQKFTGTIPQRKFWWTRNAREGGFIDCHYLQCSWVTPISDSYRRQWVYWHPPVANTPLHLYWWSEELLLRRKAEK